MWNDQQPQEPLPMKKGESSVLHVRVPKKELKTLKKAGADIPEIVRQAIKQAATRV